MEFDHKLDGYQPLKKEYNFYFTYKMVHPWWDAVALGIEDAAKQYEEKGIIINYEYLAGRRCLPPRRRIRQGLNRCRRSRPLQLQNRTEGYDLFQL